jgi:DNA invertase Pin-like site-specific DNA recombinase
MPRKRRVPSLGANDKTVDGYVRVSTDEQSRDGLSLTHQETKIRGYCELFGLELVRMERDEGISAKSLERRGLRIVLEDLRKGRVGGLVIYKLDRLTRSLGDWSNLIDELFSKTAGRLLHSVEEKIDTSSAGGLLVLDVLMSVAQWERRIIAERTADALQGKISRGERCGRIRFGYTLGDDAKTLVPHPAEQHALDFMRQWRAQGKTYREMIETLEKLGIQCKEPGSVWQPGTIHRILARPIP